MRDQITLIIQNSISELNETRSSNDQIIFSNDLVLFGQNSPIDSLDLVSVITDVEERLADDFNINISLTDDRALSRIPSPYDSVNLLVDFIEEVVQESMSN